MTVTDDATQHYFVQQHATPGAAHDPTTAPALFQPLTIRDVTFPNRIQVSPMCMFSAHPVAGIATDFHLVHVGQFALRGVGLTMMEAAAVTPEGRICPNDLGLWSDTQIAPLKRIADFVHHHEGKLGIQLAHAGRKACMYAPFVPDLGRGLVPESDGGWPNAVVAPSAVQWDMTMAMPHELSVDEIQALVTSFAAAAVRCDQAGFDVVEIHGAHGYLIHQFLSPVSNTRTDAYGGPLENRARFLVEIVQAVRAVWPAEKPVFLRLSCTDWVASSSWDIDEVIEVAKLVAPLGVDVLDCSSGGNHPEQKIPVGPLYQVPFAHRVKEAVPSLKVVAVGLITSAQEANEVVEEGKADAVMLAREFLRDGWVYHAAHELGVEVAFIDQYRAGKRRPKM
ncbi:hypothetical protein AMAG_07655 [Allomyces macrogynus ATCC 38327]|uniref:NADH:flavin oxidoreductase/NADH oxidase N-terminal domain-containing protein n=1 Tax=Allomyces macrogynus (strain ATCC 38327) TaxID=578462 RepID=A0A0L0SIV4_ALLM3|nr:hypothetical protein AMAG_07655 [Allomyces macrogynus ATCC 38327]|eukprot:KNE62436.1 hypothetical protein AMAG_07655 [Allomyces macrogynus ATCC 38327]